jgi:hypothetical protein
MVFLSFPAAYAKSAQGSAGGALRPFQGTRKMTYETIAQSTTKRTATAMPGEKTALIVLVLAQFFLFLIPLVVLGQAIGWPASLRLPADEILPLIAQKAFEVQVGYWGYMLTSVAFVPLAVALRRHAIQNGETGLLVDAAAALGVAAGVLKTLGIVRWLAAMPALATLYTTNADPTVRTALEVSYLALNGYAGGVGELLGVQLFSGLWLVATGIILQRLGYRFNGLGAVVIGLGFLATASRTILPAAAEIQGIIVPVALLWFLSLAIAIWRRKAA